MLLLLLRQCVAKHNRRKKHRKKKTRQQQAVLKSAAITTHKCTVHALHCTPLALHSTPLALHCTALHYTALHCIALHCMHAHTLTFSGSCGLKQTCFSRRGWILKNCRVPQNKKRGNRRSGVARRGVPGVFMRVRTYTRVRTPSALVPLRSIC